MYKDKDFDLKGLKKSLLTRNNTKVAKERRDKTIKELEEYFGSPANYKAFMNHTLFPSFKINISASPVNFLYDESDNPFDFVTVEFPIYPVDDRTWADSHKKELFRYAMIRLKNHPDYSKFKVPVSKLKLYLVTWDCEFIVFHLCIK